MASLVVLTLVAALVGIAGPAGAAGTFHDDDGSLHEEAIETIVADGITRGCNPPANDRYCPDDPVTRGQMAAFLNRLLDLRSGATDRFDDDDSSVFEKDINAIANAGITAGCNPPANDRYCPDRTVTRGEMAAFLVRALEIDHTGSDYFSDDRGSVFETDINALARVGITRGCNPPQGTAYCPNEPISRAQMASFLARAREIASTGTTTTAEPPATSSTTTPTSGAFQEKGGVVVMEVESVPLADGWSRRTDVGGYTGSAFYYRTGESTRQTGEGVLRFDIAVSEPGTYAVSIRARRDQGSGEHVENDKRNDVFVKMDSDQWWKATTHAAFGEWGWIDKKSIAHATFEPLVWQLGPGSHSFFISGRSEYVKIDRVHVFEVDQGSALSEVRRLNPPISTPESPRTP